MAEDFSLDLEELRQLQSIAKRPRVVSLISSEILKLEKVQSLKQPASLPAPAPIPAPIATGVKVPTPAVSYVTLSFSWDQDTEKVKVYVFLEGVGQDKIETEFKPMSIDVKFHDVQGKNYRCAIPKLNREIVPEKCKVTVKLTRVIITLFKASKENWPDLQFKEDRLKPNLGKDEDPMGGIMDLMKVQSLKQPASVPAPAPIPAPIATGVVTRRMVAMNMENRPSVTTVTDPAAAIHDHSSIPLTTPPEKRARGRPTGSKNKKHIDLYVRKAQLETRLFCKE